MLYRHALEQSRPKEPPGYREAGNYIKGNQVTGAVKLLAMLLGTPAPIDGVPLITLAESVFPSGHTAFVAKPDIPTYLVGNADELRIFYELIPAPNESYTNLFWPGDTAKLDAFIQQKRQEEKEARKKNRQQPTLFASRR